MENSSVIISSITPRIEYYTNQAGLTSKAINNYIKKKMHMLESDITPSRILNVKRLLQACNLAMGEKRTTEKMYLERDLKYIDDIFSSIIIEDKNKGRKFVDTMKQTDDELNSGVQLNGKTLTKVNPSSQAYKFFSDAA